MTSFTKVKWYIDLNKDGTYNSIDANGNIHTKNVSYRDLIPEISDYLDKIKDTKLFRILMND